MRSGYALSGRAGVLAFGMAYSLALLVFEFTMPRRVVKNFYDDIDGPYPFYAMHTTLCVALWWGTALTFAFCHLCARLRQSDPSRRHFFLAQMAIFAYIGIDDRFKAHEWQGRQLGIKDEWPLLVVGLAIVGVLYYWRRVWLPVPRASKWIVLAVVVSTFALAADAMQEGDVYFGLEDIPKAWAALFYFLFTWEICLGEATALQQSGRPVQRKKRAAATNA